MLRVPAAETDPEYGLTLAQVAERTAAGCANLPVEPPTRTVGQIVLSKVEPDRITTDAATAAALSTTITSSFAMRVLMKMSDAIRFRCSICFSFHLNLSTV